VTVRRKIPWQALVAIAAVTVVGGAIGGAWSYYYGLCGFLIAVIENYFLGAIAGYLIARRWPQRLEVTP
jgi:hypothetical protein